mgnify:CR=1 FL=1
MKSTDPKKPSFPRLLLGFLLTAALPLNAWIPEILHPDHTEYLPDYSYAGYRWGEETPPRSFDHVLRLTDFGAMPGDGEDDTHAFEKALESADSLDGRVLLSLPAGELEISAIVYIERGSLVIRGAEDATGAPATVLRFDQPLSAFPRPPQLDALYQYLVDNRKYTGGELFSLYSWTGGFFWTRHPEDRQRKILELEPFAGRRGSHQLRTRNGQLPEVGETLLLSWRNPDGQDSPLLEHFFGDCAAKAGSRFHEDPDKVLVDHPLTITGVEGRVLTFKEPLLHDVRPGFACRLEKPQYIEEVGLENLHFAFPDVPYAGHHRAAGFNGLYLTDLRHSWVDNLVFDNADSAILSDFCANVTLTRITTTGRKAHYTLHTGNCFGLLWEDARLENRAHHNPSFNTGARYSVYTGCYVHSPHLDQHSGNNHQNLFDNLEVFSASHLFRHGGAGYFAPTSGLYNTFWNVRSYLGGNAGSLSGAPESRLIGLRGERRVLDFGYNPAPYEEGRNREGIAVVSLYHYQRYVRLSPFAEDTLRGDYRTVSPWLGPVLLLRAPWIHHEGLGWLYWPLRRGDPAAGCWFWRADSGWVWTTPALYPVLYCSGPARWRFFHRNPRGPGGWFYDYLSGEWVS